MKSQTNLENFIAIGFFQKNFGQAEKVKFNHLKKLVSFLPCFFHNNIHKLLKILLKKLQKKIIKHINLLFFTHSLLFLLLLLLLFLLFIVFYYFLI